MPGYPIPMMYYPGGTPEPPLPVLSWYDPSDLSTLFQDSSFTVPVTADGQTVHGILDKGLGGNHLIYTTGAGTVTYETATGMGSWIAANAQILERAVFSGLSNKAQVTIVNFWQITALTGTSPSPLEFFDDTAGVHQFTPFYTAVSLARQVDMPAAVSTAQPTSPLPLLGLFVVEFLVYDGTEPAQADRMLLVQNGKEQLNGTLASINATTSANPIRFYMFGRDSATNYCTMNWWGGLVYDRLLTADEKNDISLYAYAQRGIPSQYLPNPADWYQAGTSNPSGVSVNGGPNPYTVARPIDAENGDIILWLHLGTTSVTTDVPWTTLATQSTPPYGVTLQARQVTASEPANYTFTKGSGSGVSCTVLVRIRGGIIKASTVQNGTGSTSTSSLTVPSVTPVLFSEGIRLVGVVWLDPQTMTLAPAGMTLIANATVATVPNALNMQIYMEEIGSGATGTKTINFSGSTIAIAVETVLS